MRFVQVTPNFHYLHYIIIILTVIWTSGTHILRVSVCYFEPCDYACTVCKLRLWCHAEGLRELGEDFHNIIICYSGCLQSQLTYTMTDSRKHQSQIKKSLRLPFLETTCIMGRWIPSLGTTDLKGLCFYAVGLWKVLLPCELRIWTPHFDQRLLASSCLSVSPHGTIRLSLDGFP
jgi:hypothetical protein